MVQVNDCASPVPIVLSSATIVYDVTERIAQVWKSRGKMAEDNGYEVELYHDKKRRRAVSTSSRGSGNFFTAWMTDGLTPLLYAQITDIPLSVVGASSFSSSAARASPSRSQAPTAPLSPASSSSSPPVPSYHPVTFPVIIMRGDRRLHWLRVDEDVRVEQIKRIVEVRERIAVSRQALLFSGQAMEDSHSLGSYGVGEATELDLDGVPDSRPSNRPVVLSIWVDIDSRSLPFRITPSFTCADLKLLIQDEEKHSAGEQSIRFKGDLVRDESNLVQDCGVEDGSHLDLVLRAAQAGV